MDLYYLAASPPCRSVIMAARVLNLKLNLKELDVLNGEQLKPEFVKINPQHTIPTLVDDGFSLWESRAILIYLAEKYDKTKSLYPDSPAQRGVINQRLYFDMGTLFKSFSDYYVPFLRLKKPADPEMFKKVEDAFELLNTFLDGQSYVAGDRLTIADLSILATVSTIDLVGFDMKKYSNVTKWYENCKRTVPGWAENWEGCLLLKKIFS